MKRTNFTLLWSISKAFKGIVAGILPVVFLLLATENASSQTNPLPPLKDRLSVITIVENELAWIVPEVDKMSAQGRTDPNDPVLYRLGTLANAYTALKSLLQDPAIEVGIGVAQIYGMTNMRSTLLPLNTTMSMGYFDHKWPAEFTEIVEKLKR
jgi:hypothetical protein